MCKHVSSMFEYMLTLLEHVGKCLKYALTCLENVGYVPEHV